MWVQLVGLLILVLGIVIAVIPTAEEPDGKKAARAGGGQSVKTSRSAGSRQKRRTKKGKKRSSRAPLSDARKNFASRLELQLAGSSGSSATLPRQKSAAKSPGKLGDGQKDVQKKLDSLFAQPSFNERSIQRKAPPPMMEGSTQIKKAAAPPVQGVGGDGEKYERMRRAGVPEAAIEQAKLRDMAGGLSELKPKQSSKKGSNQSTAASKRQSKKRSSKRRGSKTKKRKRGFFAGLFSKKPVEEVVSTTEEKKPAEKVPPPVENQNYQGNAFMQELSSRLVRVPSRDFDDA